VLLSARPDELPETVLSRCHVVTFQPLAEQFVADTLAGEGVEPSHALLAARLAGGNLGRARRLATGPDGLAFRDVGAEAVRLSETGARGALDAADVVLEAAETYRKGLKDQLDVDLAPFLDERGRPEEAYRGAIRRLEERHKRRVKRAERDYVDWVLLGVSSLLRDRVVAAVGGGEELAINLDIRPEWGQTTAQREDLAVSARGLAAIEEARAALAEELNLNPRLVLERAFLQLAESAV
jgi:DNA polymerase-3 subunit delta'